MRNVLFTVLALLILAGAIGAVVVFYLWWRMPALRDAWERWRARR